MSTSARVRAKSVPGSTAATRTRVESFCPGRARRRFTRSMLTMRSSTTRTSASRLTTGTSGTLVRSSSASRWVPAGLSGRTEKTTVARPDDPGCTSMSSQSLGQVAGSICRSATFLAWKSYRMLAVSPPRTVGKRSRVLVGRISSGTSMLAVIW